MVMADLSGTDKSVAFGCVLYGMYSLLCIYSLNILLSAGHLIFSSPFSHVVELQQFEMVFEKAAVYFHTVQLLTWQFSKEMLL